jgi:opacity protein-like surface antigen
LASGSNRRFLLIAVLLLSLAVPASAQAACDPSVPIAKYDDESAMLSGGGGTFVQDSQWIAQSFVLPAPERLGDIGLFMTNLAPSGDVVTVQVRSDSSGLPGPVLAQVSASTTNTSSFEWLLLAFSSAGLELAGGTTYWIVAINSITNNGQGYAWQETNTAPAYPDGISRASNNQGGSWGAALNADFGFRVFCAPAPSSPGPPPPGPAAPDRAAALITRYSAFPTSFLAARRGASIPATTEGLGTTVSYTLSEDASLTFTIERRNAGRRVKGRCRKATRKNRRAKRCDLKLSGSFKHQGKAGRNSLRFSGRLSNKKLRPARYRLRAAAIDQAGNKSKPARLNFRIVKG